MEEMTFEGEKVRAAVKEIATRGQAAIDRILEEEIKPFINDVETLTTSMANLYQEHAAHFIALGVKVNIEVKVMEQTAFTSQVGASMFDDHDPNIVAKGGKDAATSTR